MAWFQRDKEQERFYLLPGQGGKNMRRKRNMFLRWSVVAGMVVSTLLAGFLYWLGKR
jgi:hypothetical protein